MQKFIAYYRVSTKKQGESGLGLQAQMTAVKRFIEQRGGKEVRPPFTEVESGKNNNRPQLEKAIQRCKDEGAKLLIAKLDRLSRNASFIMKLRDELQNAGVDFVACDMPEANTMTIGIMAVMAQHEREMISKRTKEGLQAAKERGVELGTPENLTDQARQKARETISKKARNDKAVQDAYYRMKPLREAGQSYGSIAEILNEEGYRTRTGKQFHAAQVRRIWKRLSDNN